jgi:hypothetical protein
MLTSDLPDLACPLLLRSAEFFRKLLGYVEHYNNIRLKSAVAYVSLMDMLAAASRRSTGSGMEVGRCQATGADTSAASRMNGSEAPVCL